ncbi:caspase family protein [candidate division KSB1 bacterium]|nr:caspase family protein [candidate division KSB1 bacterium]
MKIKISTTFLSIIFLSLFISLAYAQENLWISSSNFYEPQIIFSNPAGLSFQAHRQAIFSSQLLYTGLANDKLYNHYLGYVELIHDIGVFGVRGSYFNSLLLNQGTFSLLFSRSFLQSKISLGINFNLHQYWYDKSEFDLNQADDPLLANGTSKFAPGVGVGIIYRPLTDLHLGLSIDDFNQPDISLQGGEATRPLTADFGVCYRIFNFVPELDVKYFHYSRRSETYIIFGLRQLLLDNAANLSVQFQQNSFSLGGAYSLRNFRLDYRYTYPFNELQEVSNGSHQFTLCLNFGSDWGYPTTPKISFLSLSHVEVDTSCYLFQTQITDKRGLKQVKIQLNDDTITTYDYSQKDKLISDKLISLDIPIAPLKAGSNRIRIIAENDVKQSSKELVVNFKPAEIVPIAVSAPRIEILTPLDNETKTSLLRLRLSLEFILDLKDFKVKVNGAEIKLRGIRPISTAEENLELEAEFDLEAGMNEIELIAFNQRGSASQKRTVRYNPITEDFYSQRWGVVIGIDDYRNNDVADLDYAVHDARGIESLLKNDFRFDQVISLYNQNATRENIIRALSTDLKDARENDGIFIFFAGHGTTGEGITGGPLGYLVPADGTFNEKEFYVKNIPMSLIKEISQTIPAKHIYFVMDCCYGGLLLREGREKIEPTQKADYTFLRGLAKNRVRQVLTAGGKGEPVLDGGSGGHSVFTGRLIAGLQGEADFNQDGFITAEELNFFVRQHVHADVQDVVRGHPIYKNVEQTPQYGKWFGEGEFIFRISKP